MRHKRKKYMSFSECIERWVEFEEEYPDDVEIRMVDIPLLRRYYSVHMKDAKQDTVNIKYYTYANSRPDKTINLFFIENLIISDYIEMNLSIYGTKNQRT